MLSLEMNKAVDVISSPRTLTASWVDLSDVMALGDVETLTLWTNVDINNSLDVSFRLVAMTAPASTDLYTLPIQSPSAAEVSLTAEGFVLANDVDQLILVPFSLSGTIPFGKIQVKCGTVGATAGQVLSAKVTSKKVEI